MWCVFLQFFSILVQVPPYLRAVFRYGPFCIFANLTNELHPILIIMSDYYCFLLFVFLWIIACHILGLSFPVDLENLFIWTLSLCYRYFLQDCLLSFKIYSVQNFWMFMSDLLIYFYTSRLCHTEKGFPYSQNHENCLLYGNSFLKTDPFGNVLFACRMK